MKWKRVREKYPNQWVKIKINDYNITDNKKIIKDMEVIKSINDNKTASRELGNCNEDEVVYHTSNEKIYLEIKNMFGFRLVN